jgi:spermidine dehydrogenase
MSGNDRHLGMGAPITRRDFLNGMAIGVGGAMAAGWLPGDVDALLAQGTSPYPPALTGLRGSHVGSFETLHQLRDGAFWKTAAAPENTGEEYDLVVVGAGISGLAAAYYFKKARPDARILVLDNHDDFGGHAKRNEYTHNGRTYIGYGGTQSIDSPAPYSGVAKDLITELGIDVARYQKVLDAGLYKSLGLGSSMFFDKETFGSDRLVVGDPRDDAFQAAAPISNAVRRDLKRLLTERVDPMPGLSSAERKARLARMSYSDFVTKHLKLDTGVLNIFQTRTHGLFGVGVDAVPAQDAFALGLPGFAGMGLDDKPGPGQNLDSIRSEEAERYYFHFPDGNASVARLLVRRLVPGAIPGSTTDDSVTARADYGKLDVAGSPVRIRLSSSVMRMRPARRAAISAWRWPTSSAPGRAPPGLCQRPRRRAGCSTQSSALAPNFSHAEEGARLRHQVPLVYTTCSSASGRRSRSSACSACRCRGCGTPPSTSTSRSASGTTRTRRTPASPSCCTSRSRPASPACPSGNSIAPDAWNCSPRRSRPSSAASATRWAARSAAVGSIPRATSSASR